MIRADLNCDMGESFGAYAIGADEAVMPSITSANVACGYHGGDPGVMRRTVRLAREAGVAVGAHPGFPDLQGFGRRDMRIAPQDAEDMVLIRSVRSRRLHAVKVSGCPTSSLTARCTTWRSGIVPWPTPWRVLSWHLILHLSSLRCQVQNWREPAPRWA